MKRRRGGGKGERKRGGEEQRSRGAEEQRSRRRGGRKVSSGDVGSGNPGCRRGGGEERRGDPHPENLKFPPRRFFLFSVARSLRSQISPILITRTRMVTDRAVDDHKRLIRP